jgi:ABC-type glutathione transport system ATPase component
MPSQVIRAEALAKRYEGEEGAVIEPLTGADLRLDEGEFVCVLGKSGSGKSTLLGILGTLDRRFDGRLELFGRDARALDDVAVSRLRGERIGFVFQSYHLFGHLSVLDNVLVPTLFRPSSLDQTRRARSLLDELGLADRMQSDPRSSPAGNVSGSRSRVPCCSGRRSCSATSPPATSTPRLRRSSPRCSRAKPATRAPPCSRSPTRGRCCVPPSARSSSSKASWSTPAST